MAESPISGVLKSAKTTVSPDAFATALKSSEETNNLLRAQNSTLTSLANGLNGIRDRVVNLDTSLKSVATQIANESFLEKQRVAQEQQQERILAQQALREGKESVIEKKIQSALISPVQKISNTAQNVLARLREAFVTILGGWLLNQGIEAYKAYASDAKDKLVEIRDRVLKTLGVVVGVFATIRFGIARMIRGVGGLTGKILTAIGNNLFKKPFLALAGALGVGGLTRTPPAVPKPGGAKPGPGKGLLGLTGKLATVASGLMNWSNGENMDAVLAAASMIGPFRFIKVAAGLGFAADEIAELFGLNIFGEDPNKLKQAREIKAEAEKEAKANPKPAQTAPTAQAQTPMVVGKKEGEDTGKESPPTPISNENLVVITGQAQTTGTGSAAPTAASVTPQTPMMGTTPATSGGSSPTQADYGQMTTDQLKKMLDPSKTGASNPAVFAAASAAREQGKLEGLSGDDLEHKVLAATVAASESSKAAQISPTASQNLPSTIQSVGPLAPPPTNVVIAPQQSAPTQSIPSSSGTVNDVPAIPTGNPDNFYLLYSQVQYNVVNMV